MTRKMDPDVKAKWVEALRSGEYKQGKGVLEQEGKFCCLGVLCDLAVKNGVQVEVGTKLSAMEQARTTYDGAGDMPPKSVVDWAFPGNDWDNWSKDNVWNVTPDHHLPTLNDAKGWSFEDIARLVEQKF